MPSTFDGTFQAPDHGLKITVRTLPGNDHRTQVCLAGEIDMASSAILSKTVDLLTAAATQSVLVDLADLTFACSTLPNFVSRIRQVLPDGAELILWRARPATDWVLRITDMATIATIRAETTEPFAVLA